MFVGMWMAKEVIAVEPSLSLAAAAKRMAEQRIRRLPVLENANYDSPLVGIISRTDVLHASPLETNPFSTTQRDVHTASASSLLVRDVMTANPLRLKPMRRSKRPQL